MTKTTEPYNWPSQVEWRKLTRNERIERAESLLRQAEKREAPRPKKARRSQAVEHAQTLLSLAHTDREPPSPAAVSLGDGPHTDNEATKET